MATPPKKPTDGTNVPVPRKPATPRKTTTRKTSTASAAKPATRKITAASAPDEAKPSTTASPKKPRAKRTATVAKAATDSRKKWGVAAVIGGLGAAVTAGVLSLRGSTAADDDAKPNKGKHAHQADGTDSSKSFEAGIADEGTIPE